jgi:hypothetical protein
VNIHKGAEVLIEHESGTETGIVLSVTPAERDLCASVLVVMEDTTICRFPITFIKEATV